jgi:hypothetical protein
MTTGEVGFTASVDRHGYLWVSVWGCSETFCGRMFVPFGADDLLREMCESVELNRLWGLASLRSDVLSAGELRPIVDWAMDAQFEPDAVNPTESIVKCIGFEGTLEQYLAANPPTR